MSRYTTEVRYICETYAGLEESVGFDDVAEVIRESRTKVFDFDYPIFDESYREVLESKILLHYYTREIGFETVGLWKLKLRDRLNMVMPYYNQLYKSELLTFNPLLDVELTTERDSKTDNQSVGKSNDYSTTTIIDDSVTTRSSDESAISMVSDTPQGSLDGLERGEYLSGASKNDAESRGNSTYKNVHSNIGSNSNKIENKIDTTEKYIEKISGKSAGENYSKKLKDFRKTFLNIDLQVIEDLRVLFMYLW